MVTSSFTYLLFFLCVSVLYWRIGARARQNIFILVASLVFYAWWDWRFCGLLLLSASIDFYCGRAIHRSVALQTRRAWLLVSLCVNLGILLYFKYCGFFIDSAIEMMEIFGVPVHRPVLNVILPLGISFYTFQTLSYTIDIYRQQFRPTNDFVAYCCYVCFFPQLIAGPIERAGRLLPQFTTDRKFEAEKAVSGLRLILWGLFKKICVGDSIAKYADAAYAQGVENAPSVAIFGTLCFGIQIYADFSGYTDIARGSARILGFDLVKNFRLPYLATSPQDFWRRWHISLSTWFRDYVYIPLGGNRHGIGLQCIAIMVTFLLSGLWHGAGWNFIGWGVVHGFLVCISIIMGLSRLKWLGWLVTFTSVMALWVLFRSASIQQALDMFSQITAFRPSLDELILFLDWLIGMKAGAGAGVFLAVLVMTWLEIQSSETDTPFDILTHRVLRWSAYTICLWWLVGASFTAPLAPFIYFNF